MRLKALDLYFAFLKLSSIYEHFMSICGALNQYSVWKNVPKISIFEQFPTASIDAREVLGSVRKMQKMHTLDQKLCNAPVPMCFWLIFIKITYLEVHHIFSIFKRFSAIFTEVYTVPFWLQKSIKTWKFHWFWYSNMLFVLYRPPKQKDNVWWVLYTWKILFEVKLAIFRAKIRYFSKFIEHGRIFYTGRIFYRPLKIFSEVI